MYDYERWLSGRFSKNTVILTPQYFLQEIQKLNAHIAVIDVYRMNKQLLHQYLMFLLADEKMAILQLKAEEQVLQDIIGELLKAILPLPSYYAKEILARLKVLAEGYPAEETRIDKVLNRIIREEIWQRSVPWLVLLVTLLLCITMYLFGKK